MKLISLFVYNQYGETLAKEMAASKSIVADTFVLCEYLHNILGSGGYLEWINWLIYNIICKNIETTPIIHLLTYLKN